MSLRSQNKVARIMIEGFQHLEGYLDLDVQRRCLEMVHGVLEKAPLYRPRMPRSGKLFSILMSNCGDLGWVSDKDGGYRYQSFHPETREPWPAIPLAFLEIWGKVADWPTPPEACLINSYSEGTKLGSHVDADEPEKYAPVVSVSLGDDAVFHVGGSNRADPKQRLILKSGDVVVLGGAARRAYHGIDQVVPGTSDLLPGGGRINLTLRRVTVA